MKFYMPFEKVEQHDDGTVTVSGVASSETKDSQGEIITSDAMKAAIPDYMSFGGTGALREMHQPIAAGVVLKAAVNEAGLTHIEAKVVDANSVQKVLKGVFKGFSIGGKVTEKDGHVIKGLSLREISLVDRPANPDAVFSCFKADDGGEELKKSLYTTARLAVLLDELKCLAECEQYESAVEGEMSTVTPSLKTAITALAAALVASATEESAEPEDGDVAMADKAADLQKADFASIAKAQITVMIEPLQKALESFNDAAELYKADLTKRLADAETAHKAEMTALTERLAKVEAAPAAPKAVVRTISKTEENGGVEPLTKVQIEAELAKMHPEERTRLMMKAALANPIQAA